VDHEAQASAAAPAALQLDHLYGHLIGGRRLMPDGPPDVIRSNPARTGEVVGELRSADRRLVEQAVRAAAAAWQGWRATPAPRRGAVLLEASRLLAAHREALARLIVLEEGKALRDARAEVERCVQVTEFIAGEGRRFGGYTAASESPSRFAFTIRQPLGVVAAITPWNFPLAIPAWKVAPALIAGNAVILKPSTLTPACAVRLGEIYREAGLPDGVLNVLVARRGEAAEALLDAPEVAAVSFTGSTPTGRGVAARCAARGAATQAELGGKNAAVVLADADLDLAAAGIAQGAFGSTGQRCTATSRVIVEQRVADALVDRLITHAAALVVGDGMSERTDLGPAVSAEQQRSVLAHVEAGRAEGAELAFAGRVDARADGHWLAPMIFDHVTPEMHIAREEIFGPVTAVIRVPAAAAALAAANMVEYGLAASIYSRDVRMVFRFAEDVEVGIAHVNQPTLGGEVHLPFGGVKASGMGPHEQGREATDFFSRIKTIYINHS
jgi:acyl-CoA reductase-like NAD-dependent aldehyde dehydrogenase